MALNLYIGKIKNSSIWEKFYSDFTPTEETHGRAYSICEGPIKTMREAEDRISFWKANPNQTVSKLSTKRIFPIT